MRQASTPALNDAGFAIGACKLNGGAETTRA
jgi:hypothetical protein